MDKKKPKNENESEPKLPNLESECDEHEKVVFSHGFGTCINLTLFISSNSAHTSGSFGPCYFIT